MEKVIPKSEAKFLQKFCFRFWNYFLYYIIQIIFIVFNIYSVDENDLQRDEVAIIKVFVNIYIYIFNQHLYRVFETRRTNPGM